MYWFTWLTSWLVASCLCLNASGPQKPLLVASSILPVSYLIQHISGDLTQVVTLVQPGQSEEAYTLTPQQMAEFTQCKAYFYIGLPFESALIRKAHQMALGPRCVDLRTDLVLLPMQEHTHCLCAHKSQDSSGMDPHIWMSPKRMIAQASVIAQTLESLDPEHSQAYQHNYQALKHTLEVLDQQLASKLTPYQGRTFFTYHPSFGYLAADYGLKQKAIEAGGKEPNAKELQHWIILAQSMGIRGLIVQPQFNTQSAKVIAQAIHANILVVDPMASNYPQSMHIIADAIIDSLGPQAHQPTSSPPCP